MKKIPVLMVVFILAIVTLNIQPVKAEPVGVELQGLAVPSYDGNAYWYNDTSGEINGNITTIEVNDLDKSPRGADDAINDRFAQKYDGDPDIFNWNAEPSGEKYEWEWYDEPNEPGENLFFLAEYQYVDRETGKKTNYTWASNWHADSYYTPDIMEDQFMRYEPIPKPEPNPVMADPVGTTWVNLSISHFKYTDYSEVNKEPYGIGNYHLFQSYAVFMREKGDPKWRYMGNSRQDPEQKPVDQPIWAYRDQTNPKEVDTGADCFNVTGLDPGTGYYFIVRPNFRTIDEPTLGPVWGYMGGLGGKSKSTSSFGSRAPEGGSITPFSSSGSGGVCPTDDADPPSAPQNLVATGYDNYVDLDWDAPSDNGGDTITDYYIYRGTTSGGESYYDNVGSATTSYTDTSVTNGVTYYYKVAARNSAGTGTQSNEDSALPQGVPSAPLNLAASPGDSYVYLDWDPPSDDGGSSITDYYIYRGTTSGGESYHDNVGSTATNYNDTSVTNGQQYFYYVTAINGVGEGSASGEVSATPQTTPTEPLNPTATEGDSYVYLDWDPPSDDGGSTITDYYIHRGTSPSGESYLDNVGSASTAYNDTTVDPDGSTYYYYMTAVNGVGEGTQSTEVSGTPYATTSTSLTSTGQSDGWNFVSTSVVPDDTEITSILDNSTYGIPGNYDKVMYFQGEVIFYDSFDDRTLSGDWTVEGTGSGSVTDDTHNSGSYSLRVGESEVNVTSKTIDISSLDSSKLTVWVRRGSDTFSENPESSDDLRLMYLNDGYTWVELEEFEGGGTPGEIMEREYILPADALHPDFQIKFYQIYGSGSDFDFWHIDDVTLYGEGDNIGIWNTYVPGRADKYNSLTHWDRSMGLWIHMTDDDTLTVKGIEPVNTTVFLHPGWNLVGYPSQITGNNGLPSEITKIGYFDETQEYNINYNYDPGTYTFAPNKAYWIYNSAGYAVEWTIDYKL